MKQFFQDFWAKCVELYIIYSDFVHSIFPSDIGDIIEYVIDIAVVCLIIKLVASAAFDTKNKG